MADTRAMMLVNQAVRDGNIDPISTQKCVDCGKQARHYDHRDYNKPLDIEPVCCSCNYKRGPALPRKDFIPDPRAILHMKLPATLKKRVKVAAIKADITMQEWVLTRIKIGLRPAGK